MGIANIVPHLPRLIRKGGLPLHLTFFVTARCNALCQHCFYWDSLNKGQHELSLDEIDRIASSMRRALWIAFTGGEPFLRQDLPEFAKILHDRLRPVTLSINTNGIKTDQIVASAERLAANCPRTFVGILCSLDGLGATHDRIRGVPDNFNKTVRTFRELQTLSRRTSNLGVGISTTFCAWNQDEMDKMYEFVVNELKPDNWDLSFVRGKPMAPAIGIADVERYRRIKQRLEMAFEDGTLKYYSKMPLSRFVRAKERVATGAVLRTLETGAFQLPCHAGALSAVISEEGDVYACEMLADKLGNLRDANYDIAELWRGERAVSMRRFIRDSQCFCTHECNMSINHLFSLSAYPEILTEMGRRLVGREVDRPVAVLTASGTKAKVAPMSKVFPILPDDRR